MASPNINLRDPLIYRIRKVTHQRREQVVPLPNVRLYALPLMRLKASHIPSAP